MPISRFKSYNPGDKPYARRRTDEEWEPHRQILTELHAQRYTRKEMLARLKDAGFEVSPGQLLSQMKKWDMMVYGERATQSGSHQLLIQKSDLPEASEPRIQNYEAVEDSLDPSNELNLPEEPLLLPSLHDSLNGSSRRYSTTEQSDITVGGLSLSSVEEGRDAEVSLQHEPHSEIPPDVEPPAHHLVEQLIVDATASSLEVNMADSANILTQISTITEPWCGNFPSTCCCNALFFGHDEFAKSPTLYGIILEQSSPLSLKRIMALLNLAAINPKGEERINLQKHLSTTIEDYLTICTRPEYKNRLAPHILHRLLKIWEDLSNGEHSSFPGSDLLRYYAARTNDSLLKRVFKTKPSTERSNELSFPQINWHGDSERDVGCVVGFTVRKPSMFPLLNSDGEIFGSIDSWSTLKDHDEPQRSLSELLPTARQIAAYMQARSSRGLTLQTAYALTGCDLPLIFMALGLMIALEASTSAQNLVDPEAARSDQGAYGTVTQWTPGIRAFIEATINTLSLNADYADKFRKSYWLIKCGQIGHGGKTVHMGEQCTASKEWKVLERSIHAYDEERTWFERRLFSGKGNTWPQHPDDLVMDGTGALGGGCDNMSTRSTSSVNSFRRFQALALHLKIGSPMSRSLRTKSTKSLMSTESHLSWQLERILEIRNPDPSLDIIDDDDFETERMEDVIDSEPRLGHPGESNDQRSNSQPAKLEATSSSPTTATTTSIT